MTSLEAARQLLPAWLSLVAGLPLVPIGFGIGLLGTGLAIRVASIGIRPTEHMHWTVTAAALHPARRVATISMGLCIGFAAAGLSAILGPLCPMPELAMRLAIGAAALMGGALPAARVAPAPAFRKGTLVYLRNLLTQLFFFHLSYFVLAAMLLLLEPRFDTQNLVLALFGFLAYTGSMLWGALPLARVLGVLRPPSPRLRAAVERASERTGVLPRQLFEIEFQMVNAFAVLVPRWIVFTKACSALEDRDLQAIAAHELGHLSEPRAVVYARVLAGYRLFAVVLLLVFRETLSVDQMLTWLVVLVVAHYAQRAFKRRMEMRADRVAHAHEEEAGTYALALEHMSAINLTPAVLAGLAGRSATHPALYDRMKAAGVEPSWPRPLPPSQRHLWAAIGVLLVSLLATAALLGVSLMGGVLPLWSIALRGGSAADFGALGDERAVREDIEGALVLYRAAADIEPSDDPFYRTKLAGQLAIGGRCDESRVELERARAHVAVEHRNSWWMERPAKRVAAACGAAVAP